MLRQSWAAAQALKAPDDPSAEGAQRGLEAAEQHQLAAAGQAQPVATGHSSGLRLCIHADATQLISAAAAPALAADTAGTA